MKYENPQKVQPNGHIDPSPSSLSLSLSLSLISPRLSTDLYILSPSRLSFIEGTRATMGCARQLREAIESVSKRTLSFRDKLIYFTLLCFIFNGLIIFDFPSNLDLNAKINAVIEAIILVSISCIIKPKWIKNLKLLVVRFDTKHFQEICSYFSVLKDHYRLRFHPSGY